MQFPGENTKGGWREGGPVQDKMLRATREFEAFNYMNIQYRGTFYAGSQGQEVDLVFDTGSAVRE